MIGKEEINLSLFIDIMIVYVEDLQNWQKKLKLVNEYIKVAGFKVT